MIEKYVDYLQYSGFVSEQPLLERGEKKLSGIGFYNRGYEDVLGRKYFFGNPKSKKALVIQTGRSLHNMRVVGYKDRDMIAGVIEKGGNITRLDMAITEYIEDELITTDDISKLCELGKVTGTLVKYGYKQIAGADVGEPLGIETCYIGSPKRRGKNGIFRAYDKGIEMDIGKYMVTRLELEERGKNAHNSAKRLSEGHSIGSVINTRIQFDDNGVNRLFDAKEVDMSRGAQFIESDDIEKQKNRWIWLMKQVAPALRKAVENDRKSGKGDDNLLQFLKIARIID